MIEKPRHSQGRFLYLPLALMRRVGFVRSLPRGHDVPLPLPGGWYPIAREPDRNAVLIAPTRWLWLARLAWWINHHKWDGVDWCRAKSLMYMKDGDYYANARFRFPWRRLPSFREQWEAIAAGQGARYSA